MFSLGFPNFNILDAETDPLQRKILKRGLSEMLSDVLVSEGLETTPRQRDLLAYCFELLLVVPNSSLSTLLDILLKDGKEKFSKYFHLLGDERHRW